MTRRIAYAVSITALLLLTAACTGVDVSPPKVMHGFKLEVDRGTVGVAEVEYRYGDLGLRTTPQARSGTTVTSVRGTMIVPEVFYISWNRFGDGTNVTHYVPVRSKLPADMQNKTVAFVIVDRDVEGYLITPTPKGEQRERFY